jgi:hypothetical protein
VIAVALLSSSACSSGGLKSRADGALTPGGDGGAGADSPADLFTASTDVDQTTGDLRSGDVRDSDASAGDDDRTSDGARWDDSPAAEAGRDVNGGGGDGDLDRDRVDAGSVEAGTLARPPGYFMMKDWSPTKLDWAGCVWTDTDRSEASTSIITPIDFTQNHTPADPYAVAGELGASVGAFARLAFNLTEPITGDPKQCEAGPHSAVGAGISLPTTPGIVLRISWTSVTRPTYLGVELIGAAGGVDDRWCATMTDSSGPSEIGIGLFRKQCWSERTGGVPGDVYKGEPISAVSFVVLGLQDAAQPFDFSISAFGFDISDGVARRTPRGLRRLLAWRSTSAVEEIWEPNLRLARAQQVALDAMKVCDAAGKFAGGASI